MIQTYRSSSISILADQLTQQLMRNTPDDPFEPVQIVVPNLETARWLKHTLAERAGIFANGRFILPAEWQFLQVRKKFEELPSQLPSDPAPLTWRLFQLLMDDESRQRFSRLDQYIGVQPDGMEEQAAMQLAGKIASVFDQYIVYRPGMLRNWLTDEPSADPDIRWQARLWRRLDNDHKNLGAGQGFASKPELILDIIEELAGDQAMHPEPLYLFNTGLIPKPVIRMVKKLATQTEVYIYRVGVQKGGVKQDKTGNVLLKAFGEEASAAEGLYSHAGGNTHELYPKTDAPPTSLLQKIQRSVMNDQPTGSWELETTGIDIRSCHTPLREIEVLHKFLIRQFEQDDELRPDDVVVLTPNLELYKPFIHAVFGTPQEGLPYIPYHAGFDSSGDTGIKRVVLHLFDLIGSRFSFSDVMDLFMEEIVRTRFDVSEPGAERIKRWMKENNVMWGLDSEHRRQEGQPASESQTWQSAMRRGWKGILIGAPDDPLEESNLYFDKISGRDRQEEWSSFSAYLNTLGHIQKEISQKKDPEAWCDMAEHVMEQICSEESRQSREADVVRGALDAIRDSAKTAGMDLEISYSLFRSRFTNLLEKESASTALFTRGVTFSSMVPLRSIPAKIIALIGLNESDFPRKPKHADFDLMARNPEPGERNRKHEDRHLFLESIMAAENIHYCSYIGQSRQDNEPIPPSPIVSEWINCVADALGITPGEVVVTEPLHSYSAKNFLPGRSAAKTEFRVSKLIRQSGNKPPGLEIHKPLPVPKESSFVSLDDLFRFYKNPVRSFFTSRFQPDIKRFDELKKEFSLNALEKHILFERVFGWRLDGRSPGQILHLLKQTGDLPESWQGEAELQGMINSVDTAIELIQKKGFEPIMKEIELEISTEDSLVTGTLLSYSDTCFLDITSSAFSGSKVFLSWLRHLGACISGTFKGRPSHFMCDLKKGDPLWVTFTPPDDAGKEMEKAIELYQSGLLRPRMIFPSTAYEYQKQLYRNKQNPEKKAATTFEGSKYSTFAENRDFYLSLLLGEKPGFDKSLIQPEFQALLESMLNHMNPVK